MSLNKHDCCFKLFGTGIPLQMTLALALALAQEAVYTTQDECCHPAASLANKESVCNLKTGGTTTTGEIYIEVLGKQKFLELHYILPLLIVRVID